MARSAPCERMAGVVFALIYFAVALLVGAQQWLVFSDYPPRRRILPVFLFAGFWPLTLLIMGAADD